MEGIECKYKENGFCIGDVSGIYCKSMSFLLCVNSCI